jgi:hypothetical protein
LAIGSHHLHNQDSETHPVGPAHPIKMNALPIPGAGPLTNAAIDQGEAAVIEASEALCASNPPLCGICALGGTVGAFALYKIHYSTAPNLNMVQNDILTHLSTAVVYSTDSAAELHHLASQASSAASIHADLHTLLSPHGSITRLTNSIKQLYSSSVKYRTEYEAQTWYEKDYYGWDIPPTQGEINSLATIKAGFEDIDNPLRVIESCTKNQVFAGGVLCNDLMHHLRRVTYTVGNQTCRLKQVAEDMAITMEEPHIRIEAPQCDSIAVSSIESVRAPQLLPENASTACFFAFLLSMLMMITALVLKRQSHRRYYRPLPGSP